MKKITIIIPFLNEGDEPINTIDSIYQTANPEDFEILAIDDVSFDNIDFSRFNKYKDVKFVRNEIRLGVDGCRDIAINMVTTPYVIIIDAHMRFRNDNWLNKIVDELEKDPMLLLCTKSTGLNEENPNTWDINLIDDKDGDANCGVDIYPYLILQDSPYEKNIFDARWKKRQLDKGYMYEVPCVMGANYASSVNWLKHIRGFKGLLFWGASEQFISMKTWLAGGSVKVLTTVLIGHLYRVKTSQGFTTELLYVLYNFLLMAYVLFDDIVSYNLLSYCLIDNRYKDSFKLLNENILELENDRKYYKSIFIKDVVYLESKLNKFIINSDGIDNKITDYNIKQNLKKGIENDLVIKRRIINTYKKQLDNLQTLDIGDDRRLALIDNIVNRFPTLEKELTDKENELAELTFSLENDFKKYMLIK